MTASDILRHIDEESLYKVLRYYGEENTRKSRMIARAVVESRLIFRRLKTTRELADLIQSLMSEEEVHLDKLKRYAHPATKTFRVCLYCGF